MIFIFHHKKKKPDQKLFTTVCQFIMSIYCILQQTTKQHTRASSFPSGFSTARDNFMINAESQSLLTTKHITPDIYQCFPVTIILIKIHEFSSTPVFAIIRMSKLVMEISGLNPFNLLYISTIYTKENVDSTGNSKFVHTLFNVRSHRNRVKACLERWVFNRSLNRSQSQLLAVANCCQK